MKTKSSPQLISGNSNIMWEVINRSLVRVQEEAQNSTVVQLVRMPACLLKNYRFEFNHYLFLILFIMKNTSNIGNVG
jgi:hypothetical protein